MTSLNDVPSNAALQTLYGPAALTANTNASAVAMLGDGPEFVLVHVGTPSSGASVAATLEESTDSSTWTAVANGAVPAKTAAALVGVTILRTKPYLRVRFTVTGSTPSIPVVVIAGQQKKLW